jgi:hypothetical protein
VTSLRELSYIELEGKAFIPRRVLALLMLCLLGPEKHLTIAFSWTLTLRLLRLVPLINSTRFCGDESQSYLAVDRHLMNECR